MARPIQRAWPARWGLGFCVAACISGAGCRTASAPTAGDQMVGEAVRRYTARRSDQLLPTRHPEVVIVPTRPAHGSFDTFRPIAATSWSPAARVASVPRGNTAGAPFSLGVFNFVKPQGTAPPVPTTQPFIPPEGYWRQDVWHQMGNEAASLGTRDFWRGFKTSYWNVPNILLLTATMGGSIAIRETGVDDTIRNRTRGEHNLADMSETIGVIGHPATHLGAAGVLWLVSDFTKDMKEHEVAKSLIQALTVTDVSTLLLKASTNTRGPDNDHFSWPSGHASSAFATAAVLNEYYGPWVGLPSFAMAGLVGYQRIGSREHDFSDVVFGAMLGYVIGTSVARDGKAQFPELFGMKVIPYVEPNSGSTGLALLKEW
jgi:membrane-associated phospholipid phosphatase